MAIRLAWDLAKQSVSAWIDDDAPSMGAAIAYYTLFSIAPVLIIVIAVAGMFFGRDAVLGEIEAQLGNLIGKEGAVAIQGLVKSAGEPAQGIVATAISVAVLLVGATTVFAEVQSALDRIWKAPEQPKPDGLLNVLRQRLVSFGMILGVGFLLLVSLVVSTGLAALGKWGSGVFEEWDVAFQALNFVVSIALQTGLFAMIYKVLPRVSIAWRDVWIGATVTAVLFEIGKLAIGLYLGKGSVTSGFAAAGSIVVLRVWVYYSAQIFLLGAEFTWIYAKRRRSAMRTGASAPAQPADDATPAADDATPAADDAHRALLANARAPFTRGS
jgi:membrane protein